ncbi:hypothetical protein A3Q56_05964, partial [Intoshia linei]
MFGLIVKGKEIVVKYFTKIKNEHFYTSNNGLVTVQRKYDKYKKYEENFVPITNSIYITNNLESLAILVDRSVGGTSPTAGQVDILIHRNLRHHDNLGIWESLRDNTIINTRHTFFINENVENIPLLNQIVYNEAQSICMDGIRNFTKLTPFTSEFYVHKNIHLLTFQMLGQRLLMRFQFFSGKDLAFIENICPQKIFNYLKIRNMYETSLNAAHIIEIIQKHKEGNSYDQTVHIIPHTHNDAGWLRPVDEYYYGVDGLNEATGVKYILNSVYAELMFNQNFKFVYCEIVFFSKWWNEQNYTIQNNVKYLVKNERLRFVGGGWVMNDEAVTHYSDVIDQMTIGRLFIKNTFGIEAVPSIAWQIDPFGHSVSSILIFQMMNMNDLVHWRIPEKFEKKLNKNNVVDYDWKSKDSYTSKFQFDFERYAAIVDDKHSSSYNLDSIVEYFMLYSAKMLKNTKFNDVMIPIGGDFTYENAHKIFYNVEKMIYYANIESLKYNLNVTYVVSTPYDYIKSTKQNVLPVFYDDALPLVDYNVWTGFYTTRPDLKRKIRILSIVNNNVRSLYTQYIIQTKSRNKLQHLFDKIVETLALVQHHDAITYFQLTYIHSLSVIHNRVSNKVYANWAQQVIRIFKEKSSEIEIEWIIGPIPLDNNVGKEIVVQYNAIIDNEYFYTSNNGLVTVQR